MRAWVDAAVRAVDAHAAAAHTHFLWHCHRQQQQPQLVGLRKSSRRVRGLRSPRHLQNSMVALKEAAATGSMRTAGSCGAKTSHAKASDAEASDADAKAEVVQEGMQAAGSRTTASSSATSTTGADADAAHESMQAAGSTVGELICAVGQLHALGRPPSTTLQRTSACPVPPSSVPSLVPGAHAPYIPLFQNPPYTAMHAKPTAPLFLQLLAELLLLYH
eukprot:scaffold14873_cov23-Tisochrysis_lutea.AAC.5